MRKSLLTLALACAVPVAYAQSSVTLYGIVDVGFEHLDVGSIDGTRLQSGISAGSRWGIRGSEDLRPGWRASVHARKPVRGRYRQHEQQQFALLVPRRITRRPRRRSAQE